MAMASYTRHYIQEIFFITDNILTMKTVTYWIISFLIISKNIYGANASTRNMYPWPVDHYTGYINPTRNCSPKRVHGESIDNFPLSINNWLNYH